MTESLLGPRRIALVTALLGAFLLLVGRSAPARAAESLPAVADATFRLWVARTPALILKYETTTARPYTGTPAAAVRLGEEVRDLQARLRKVPKPTSDAHMMLRDEVARVLLDLGSDSDFYWQRFAIDGYGSQIFDLGFVLDSYSLNTPAERAHYLRLVRTVAEIAAGQAEKLVGQRERGIVPPLAVVASGQKTWNDYASAKAIPGDHPLIPTAERLKAIPQAEAKRFQTDVAAIVESEVVPAARRLADALGAARAGAPTEVGLRRIPNGRQAYDSRLAVEIGRGVSADDLHRLGLSEVDRLTAQMASLRRTMGFRGSEDAFNDAVRAKPGNVVRAPDDMQRRFDRAIACIKPRLPEAFVEIPQTPARAERMPAALEATTTYGWTAGASPSQPYGIYFYNGKTGRLMTNAADLIYHELWPGHHLQYESAVHARGLHPLMIEYFSSLYSEGWAQYATVVAGELGCYADDNERYAHIQAQRLMAARLVLDTGLNAKGWTLAQATAWGRDRAGIPEEELKTELIRYGARIPGQALGYHYGMLVLLKERDRARAALGDRFDIRDWHAAMLKNGDLSAGMIRTLTDEMIRAGRDNTP